MRVTQKGCLKSFEYGDFFAVFDVVVGGTFLEQLLFYVSSFPTEALGNDEVEG
jgi:hypothetical protein